MANYEDGHVLSNTYTPSNLMALLLAGGEGTRLQELTRVISGVPIPKQYCRLLNNSSLLEATIARVQLFTPCERISVVVNQDHLDLAMEQVCGLPGSNIFIQPINRDTGPGVIFALLQLECSHPDAIVAVFPTDHYVDDDRAFMTHVMRAVHTVACIPDKIVVLGVAPDRPETGYGYILPAAPVKSTERAYYVEAFTEKPSFSNARHIISRGGLWNTFVMIFKLSRMMDLLNQYVPTEFKKLSALRQSPEKAIEIYRALGSWNFSNRVLARITQHLITLEVSGVRWSDWGTRESVERTFKALNMVPFWNRPSSAANPIPG
jgi:mannose-1-phosphate guanylyltransferase